MYLSTVPLGFNTAMYVKHLGQQKAHELLKPLLTNCREDSDLEKAFPDEVALRRKGESLWTLPKEQRTYYAVYLDEVGSPYLLIGINSWLNISSIGRVSADKKRMGVCCFKYFFAEFLVPQLKKSGEQRNSCTAVVSTDAGKRFFTRLQSDPPLHATDIRIEPLSSMASKVTIHLGDTASYHVK